MQQSRVRLAGMIDKCGGGKDAMPDRLQQLTENAEAVGLEEVQDVDQGIGQFFTDGWYDSLTCFGQILKPEWRLETKAYSL